MPATQTATDLADRTQNARKLFPIYMLFTERFTMPKPPIADGHLLKPNSDVAVIESVEKWMDELDQQIDPFQLRSVIHSSNVGASELRILALLERLLTKPHPGTQDRAKIDFLLTQLLTVRLPTSADHAPTWEEVAEALAPVLGKVIPQERVEPLESLITQMLAMERLVEIKRKSIIERGREVKHTLGSKALLPENLVACSRFNFILRRRCFELMKTEVHSMQVSLQKLAEAGVLTLDCSEAKLSGAEKVSSLMDICKTWEERKPDDYAHDNPFSQVLALQEIIELAAQAPAEGRPDTPENAIAVKTETESPRPGPEMIQFYADIAALKREHQDLKELVKQHQAEIHRLTAMLTEAQAKSAPHVKGAMEVPVGEADKVEPRPADSTVATENTVPPEPSLAEGVPTVLQAAQDPDTGAPENDVAEPKFPSAPLTLQEIVDSLTQRMEEIRAALLEDKAHIKKDAPKNLKLGNSSIMLTASETDAFVSPSSPADELICRGVAARFLLLESTKQLAKGEGTANVAMLFRVCDTGAKQLQEQSAQLQPDQAERVLETARLLTKVLTQARRT